MNALVRKEIRLVSPVWLLVLSLEIILPWLQHDLESMVMMAPIGFFFGMILLAVDPLGREFYLGTFSNLLAQPVERRQLWRTKTGVLFIGAVMIFLAYLGSCSLRLHLALSDPFNIWHANPKLIWHELGMTMLSSVLLFFVALSGGLWTALLFRQIAAAFWITFLVPLSILMLMEYFLPSSWEQNKWADLAFRSGAAAIYSVWGFWLAHRLFHRAQDAGWTGGVIAFSRWRYFESASKSFASQRKRRPIRALFTKELQLQSISWFCAAALLVLHASVIGMRLVHGRFEAHSFSKLLSEFFWATWLIMPLVIGCTAVAEERRLTVTESQFCQPVSRRTQFAIKFIPTVLAGILLGGLMPILLEGIAVLLGAPNKDLNFFSPDQGGFVSLAAISTFVIALSLTAAYASTLVTSFLQAMGLSVVLIIGGSLFTGMIMHTRSFFGFSVNPALTTLVAILTSLTLVPWLTFSNFKQLEERSRIWKRNAWSLAGGVAFILLFSTAVYHRVWEVLEPAEPAHGPAELSLAHPPILEDFRYNMLCVRLPDGRFWSDRLGYPFNVHSKLKRMWLAISDPLPRSIGPQQFLSGSNWMSVAVNHVDFKINESRSQREGEPARTNHIVGYLDTIGIRKDGTLWISKPNQGHWNGNNMTRFGTGTDWKQVVYAHSVVLLLKQDGSLWRWGKQGFNWDQWRSHWPPQWPTLENSKLEQVGTNSDWQELFANGRTLARKTDGSVWDVYADAHDVYFRRDQEMDPVCFKTFCELNDNMAYVRPDGTLWAKIKNNRIKAHGFRQVGTGKNWSAVALNYNRLIALRADGTLWIWHRANRNLSAVLDEPPTRLGIHHDWVAITGKWANTIALAADGSLWLWPNRQQYDYTTFLKLPKQPKRLADLLGNGN